MQRITKCDSDFPNWLRLSGGPMKESLPDLLFTICISTKDFQLAREDQAGRSTHRTWLHTTKSSLNLDRFRIMLARTRHGLWLLAIEETQTRGSNNMWTCEHDVCSRENQQYELA
jgi:hypothetical protein